MRIGLRSFVAAVALMLIGAGTASAEDYAATARNIIPSGQYGDLAIPPGATQQAEMYDSLTPLFQNVTAADFATKFKSEALGGSAPTARRSRPRARSRASRSSATSSTCPT